MNLNNTLCKIFEKDKNGDVTIETALITIGCWILYVICGLSVLGLFATYLYGMWYAFSGELYQNISEPAIINSNHDIMLLCMLSTISILSTVYIIIVTIATVYNSIKHTKLAKCPVNKNNNNKPE